MTLRFRQNSMLAFMINPSFGAPAFAARLVPVRNLTAEFVVEQLLVIITLIHKCGGYVFCLMSDNLKVSQKVFRLFHETYQSLNIFSTVHPVHNSKFKMIYLLYDLVHLFRNIRNNWITEKTQIADFRDPDSNELMSAS